MTLLEKVAFVVTLLCILIQNVWIYHKLEQIVPAEQVVHIVLEDEKK